MDRYTAGVLTTAFLSVVLVVVWRTNTRASSKDSVTPDPGLFKKHSTYESYSTPSGFVYPRIRTLFKEHQQHDKLPKDIPLLVFTHGLGGNATQFVSLLTSLTNVASCLTIDLPGCGLSDFAPKDPAAYTTHALAELLYVAITRFRDAANGQNVVLIGHSMGTSINCLLASSTSPLSNLLSGVIVGVIAICPLSGGRKRKGEGWLSGMTYVPIFIFDGLRQVHRRGGLHSQSITQVVGTGADEQLRKLQQKHNMLSRSAPFLLMLRGALDDKGIARKEIWSGIRVPLHLVAAEADKLTPVTEANDIAEWLTSSSEARWTTEKRDQQRELAKVPATAGDLNKAGGQTSETKLANPQRTHSGSIIKDDQIASRHAFVLKTTIFPTPSAHALPYAPSTYRILVGFIENFLARHVDERLGRGWQLQHLTTSGKWDVKNLKKWQSVDPCSEPIGGIFRAMKTMREVDDSHCPKVFVEKFGSNVLPDGVAMVVDVSHDTPVYDPRGLEDGGVEYHKFPTVSKQTPQADEIEHFISLVDRLRQSPKMHPSTSTDRASPKIAIHCHYGYNRSGMLIVCYLVERLGYGLQDAIREFADKRPPGIKHDYFVNELYVRYAVKMERRGTIVED